MGKLKTHGTGSDAYWSLEPGSLLKSLGSTVSGLSAAEAAERLQRYGSNSVESHAETSALRLLLRQFASPLVLILVFGAVVSLLMRDWIEAWIILAIVCGSCLLGFYQEYRASAAVAALRARLALTVRVRRGGASMVINTAAVVPGDIIELAAGNLVPADGVVLDARDFLVSEASLTGESFPVEKRPGIAPVSAVVRERGNCVFLGTSVRSGTAAVLAVRTGLDTEFGAVAASLRAREPETEFARGIRNFGYLLLRLMLVMVLFVLVINQIEGRPVFESLLFAVALAVGLSPELLPAIVSVTLSHGARAMARRGVLVRRLEAIENLGSIDVLCSDKTGTLTAGVISLSAAVDPLGAESREVMHLAHLNATLETGIDNPLDTGIVAAAERMALDTAGYVKVDEIPYDFIRKRLTIVVAPVAKSDEHLIITKGAVNNVLAVCATIEGAGGASALDAPSRSRLEDFFRKKSTEGFRVIAIAIRRVPMQIRYGREDESGMSFAGFLLFLDPPKPEVRKTVLDLAALGISTKVITGDNRFVSAHLAAAVGLDPRSMLTGAEIATMKDEALWHLAPLTALFVEVDPQQKERIVIALQRTGHAVGYMGDGINDAPALHAADVGISVEGATDVARESADVILLRPDLDALRRGVEDGRRTFANTLKYIAITTSANFGNMVSMALVTPVLPFLPLAAKQILLNNFLSDLPSMAISTDGVDADRIRTPQRWSVTEIRRFMIVFGLLSTVFDLLAFVVLIRIFAAGESVFQSAWFVVSLLTELAVVLVLRTRASCFRSRPSGFLLWTTVLVALATIALPYIPPLAAMFGFVPLSLPLLVVSLLIVAGYVAATEFIKSRYFATPRQ